MRKRKLTVKNLAELAKRMPVLSEDVQRNYLGRGVYFNSNGQYLGEVMTGSDDMIYVVSDNDWNKIQQKGNDLATTLNSENISRVSLSSVSKPLQQTVIKHYASKYIDDFNGSVNVNSNIQTFGNSEATMGWKDYSFNELYINPTYTDNFRKNSLISSLQHENFHKKISTGIEGEESGSYSEEQRYYEDEIEVILKQVETSEYLNTGVSFRMNRAAVLYQLWQLVPSYGNKTQEQAQAICKVNGQYNSSL